MSPAATTSGKILSPKLLAHVVLRTGQKAVMSEFYQTFLGAHAQYENEQLSFLTYDEEHHRIALLHIPDLPPKDRNTAGLEHIAFTYDNLHDLTTAYKQRKALGITPKWCVNHGLTTSMYYADPDGNYIETQIDNFDTPEQANDFMFGPLYAVNPIGVDFDPEDLIRRLEAGEPEEQIKNFPDIGARGIDSVPIF